MDFEEELLKSPIQKLDEDSLICILSKLPVADLVRVERVSKSWQEIAKKSWNNLKKLEFDAEKLGMRPVGTRHEYKKMNGDALENLLKKCGKYLKEINAPHKFDFFRDFFNASIAAKYCKNIQSISFYSASVDEIEELAENCTNIKVLSIKRMYDFKSDEYKKYLGELLSKNRNLRSLELNFKYSKIITADCLLKAPLNQMITLKTSLRGDNMINVLKHTKKLSNFYYRFKHTDEIAVLKGISIHLNNLTEIQLISVFINFDFQELDEIMSRIFRSNRQLKSIKLDNFGSISEKMFSRLECKCC